MVKTESDSQKMNVLLQSSPMLRAHQRICNPREHVVVRKKSWNPSGSVQGSSYQENKS